MTLPHALWWPNLCTEHGMSLGFTHKCWAANTKAERCPISVSELTSRSQRRDAHIPGLLIPDQIQPAGRRLQRNQPLLLPPTAEWQRSESCWQQTVILEGQVLFKKKSPFIKLVFKFPDSWEEEASSQHEHSACCPSIFHFLQRKPAKVKTCLSGWSTPTGKWGWSVWGFLLYLNSWIITSLFSRALVWGWSAYSIKRTLFAETLSGEDGFPPVSNTFGPRKLFFTRSAPGDDKEAASYKQQPSRLL